MSVGAAASHRGAQEVDRHIFAWDGTSHDDQRLEDISSAAATSCNDQGLSAFSWVLRGWRSLVTFKFLVCLEEVERFCARALFRGLWLLNGQCVTLLQNADPAGEQEEQLDDLRIAEHCHFEKICFVSCKRRKRNRNIEILKSCSLSSFHMHIHDKYISCQDYFLIQYSGATVLLLYWWMNGGALGQPGATSSKFRNHGMPLYNQVCTRKACLMHIEELNRIQRTTNGSSRTLVSMRFCSCGRVRSVDSEGNVNSAGRLNFEEVWSSGDEESKTSLSEFAVEEHRKAKTRELKLKEWDVALYKLVQLSPSQSSPVALAPRGMHRRSSVPLQARDFLADPLGMRAMRFAFWRSSRAKECVFYRNSKANAAQKSPTRTPNSLKESNLRSTLAKWRAMSRHRSAHRQRPRTPDLHRSEKLLDRRADMGRSGVRTLSRRLTCLLSAKLEHVQHHSQTQSSTQYEYDSFEVKPKKHALTEVRSRPSAWRLSERLGWDASWYMRGHRRPCQVVHLGLGRRVLTVHTVCVHTVCIMIPPGMDHVSSPTSFPVCIVSGPNPSAVVEFYPRMRAQIGNGKADFQQAQKSCFSSPQSRSAVLGTDEWTKYVIGWRSPCALSGSWHGIGYTRAPRPPDPACQHVTFVDSLFFSASSLISAWNLLARNLAKLKRAKNDTLQLCIAQPVSHCDIVTPQVGLSVLMLLSVSTPHGNIVATCVAYDWPILVNIPYAAWKGCATRTSEDQRPTTLSCHVVHAFVRYFARPGNVVLQPDTLKEISACSEGL